MQKPNRTSLVIFIPYLGFEQIFEECKWKMILK